MIVYRPITIVSWQCEMGTADHVYADVVYYESLVPYVEEEPCMASSNFSVSAEETIEGTIRWLEAAEKLGFLAEADAKGTIRLLGMLGMSK